MPKHPPTGVELIAAELHRQLPLPITATVDEIVQAARSAYLTAPINKRELIRAGALIAAALDRLGEEKR